MSFTPSVISLSHKKNRSQIDFEHFSINPEKTHKSAFSIRNIPTWLSIIQDGATDKDFRAIVKPAYANNLPAGFHSVRIEFRYKYTVGGIISKTNSEKVTVNLTVLDTVVLAISPTYIGFTYTLGQAEPKKSFLNITSENSWSIIKDAAWITLNKTNGSSNGSVEVGVDVSGLAAGNYTGNILVDDGYDKRTCKVNLAVLGANTADDFLLVTPEVFEFVEAYEQPSTRSRIINVESSAAYTLAANVPWLALSDTSKPLGIADITVSTQNTHILEYGTHQGTITVTSSYSVRTIQVLLTINESVLDGIESGDFLYADDRPKIRFTNTVPNSELVLEYSTTTAEKIYAYSQVLPFFRGVASGLIGQEAKNLINPFTFLDNMSTRCFVPVQPLSMDISVFDKVVNTTQRTSRATLSLVRVITGKTPKVENWLSYIPTTITAPKDAVVVFSFYSEDRPEEIEITGAATATYTVPLLKRDVYSCLVNLADFTLAAGNVVNIACAGHTVTVNIAPVEPEHTKIAWLNEWNCPEIFTCKGMLTITNETTQTLAKYAEEGKERSTVLEVLNPQTYSVYTGFLDTKEEVAWLHTILEAKKIWIEVEGEFIEVIRDFKSLPLYETRNLLDAYLLKFEKAVV